MAVVMCHTAECPNAELPIELNLEFTDDETGETRRVDSVSCGVCGQEISDIT